MNVLHRVTIALICTAVALALANVMLFTNRPAATPTDKEQTLSAWQRWQALEPAQRVACVQRYQSINRRANARTIWRNLREFERMSAAAQQRFRKAFAVLRNTLDRQPPARRRDLLRAPARVRAYEAYRALLAEDPARVAQLRNAWADSP